MGGHCCRGVSTSKPSHARTELSAHNRPDHADNPYCHAAAWHEAGHAIANVVVGSVEIEASVEHRDICIGRVTSLGLKDPDPADPEQRRYLVALIFAAYAGRVAEQLFWSTVPPEKRPTINAAWANDQENMMLYAERLANDSTTRAEALECGMNYTIDFFKQPVNQDAVARIGKALHAALKLDDSTIRKLCGSDLSVAPIPYC